MSKHSTVLPNKRQEHKAEEMPILHRSTEIVFDENGEKRYDSKGRMQVRSRTLRLNREKPLTPKQRAKATKAMMAARRATP